MKKHLLYVTVTALRRSFKGAISRGPRISMAAICRGSRSSRRQSPAKLRLRTEMSKAERSCVIEQRRPH